MAWSGHEKHVQISGANDAVQVGVNKVQARRGAPVTEQSGLDMDGREWLGQQWVGEQIDLPDRQVVRGPPPSVEGR